MQRAAWGFDLALVSLTFLAAFAVSSRVFTWPSFENILVIRITIMNILVFGGYIAVCSAIFSGCGFYVSHRLSHWSRQLREILLAVSFITGVLFVARYPLDFDFASNQFLAVFWLSTFAILAPSRIIAHRLLHYVRLRGRNLRSIVIVGEGLDAWKLAERIENDTILGYRVVQVIDAKEV